MKLLTIRNLISVVLLISSISCQSTSNTTTLQVEDQINPAGILDTITSTNIDATGEASVVPSGDTPQVVGDASEGLVQGEDEEDETEDGVDASSLIENKNNTIAKIVETVASDMTASIKPSVKEVKIPLDLEDLLDKVGEQMFLPAEVTTSASGSKWVQSVPRPPKRFSAFSNETGTSVADRNKPCWYDQKLSSSRSDWIWISSAFYDLMNNFAILDTENLECKRHSEIYVDNVRNFTYWAMRMRDASVLSPTGLLDANFWHFGNFDECVSMYITQPGFKIQGRYCLPTLTFRPTKEYYPDYYRPDHEMDFYEQNATANAWDFLRPNIDPAKVPRDQLHWAICIPQTCTTKDLQVSLQKSFNELSKKYPLEFEVDVQENMCYDETEREYSTGFYIFLGFFLFMCTLVGSSTFYDICIVRTEFFPVNDFLKQWSIPFSAVSNLEKLWQNNDSEELSVLHGLKTLSIIQVILGHRTQYLLGNVIINPQFTEIRIKNPFWGYFNNGTLIVDTFFVIGGFLTFFYLFEELEARKGKLNFFVIYIYRILRITPVYMVVVLFYIHVLPYMGDGPIWESVVMRESNRCRDNWWTNLLYVNNYFKTDQQCMIQAWYLACDFQFFVGGTIVVWLTWRYRKAAWPIMTSLLVFFLVYPAWVVYDGQYWSHFKTYMVNMHDPPLERFFQNVYVKAHLRAYPYVFGLACGYLYIQLKARSYKIPFGIKWGIICLFLVIGQLPYIGSSIFYIPNRPYYALENALFFSGQRIIWAAIVGYAIVGHATSGFGVLSKLFGHRITVPLGRLTFCIYLVHVIFQLMDVGTMRTPNFMSYTTFAFRMFQDVGLSIIGALALNLLIESPLDRFQKKIVKKLIRGEVPAMLAKKENESGSQSTMVQGSDNHLASNLSLAFEQSLEKSTAKV